MKATFILTAFLASAGLTFASRCKPSVPASSVSSAAPAPSCVPNVPLTGFNQNLLSSDWTIQTDSEYNVQYVPYTCSVVVNSGCIHFEQQDAAVGDMYVGFSYHAQGLIVGQAYTMTFLFHQNDVVTDTPNYAISTTHSGGMVYFSYVQSSSTWQPVTFTFTAQVVDDYINLGGYVGGGTTVDFGSFLLYTSCPETQ